MTKAYSEAGDNGGRCESCNQPETELQTQQTYPVKLADGSGEYVHGARHDVALPRVFPRAPGARRGKGEAQRIAGPFGHVPIDTLPALRHPLSS